ncbi:putative WRKY transcription factor 70 [Forsythia ovata]|uniref:WRKY transcription factor 70 n=1 Tax=Forsythia ovata TaxID=205694 RepID=A0ABD1P217_9LAMI
MESSTVRKRLIDELTRGRESTNMLRVMLYKTQNDRGCKSLLSSKNLIEKILDSFDKSLSILNSSKSNEVYDVPEVKLRHCDGRKLKDFSKRTNTSESESQIGCNKRRKSLETQIRETHFASIQDCHAWRKYGQKFILNAQHPRSYFRCTNKYDQGCQATKLVQKIQDDPPLFRTTYQGQHTCKNLFEESSHIIMDTTANNSSTIWSFDSHEPNDKPNGMVIPTLPIIQQETKEKVQNLQESFSSPSNYFLLPDLMTLESFGEFSFLSSAYDHEHVICPDVYSGPGSALDMEIEMMLGSRRSVSATGIGAGLSAARLATGCPKKLV